MIFVGIIFLNTSFTHVSAASTVKLYLNHNSYAYNKNGTRLRGKKNYVKKNKIIKAPGELQKTNTVKRYYIPKYLTSEKNSRTDLY